MTIETRTAIYGSNGLQQPRRDSTSSNGYQDSPSEDDGYFTSAVSVQHKTCGSTTQQVIATEVTSSSSSSTMEKNFKKVVWPNVNNNRSRQIQSQDEHHHHHHQESFSSNNTTDRPMAWMKNVAASAEHHTQSTAEAMEKSMEMDIQKSVWDATTGRHLSRSRSKSKNIMDRARSFERAGEAVGSAHSSRAPSRQGSSSNIPMQQLGGRGSHRRTRSPSAGRQIAGFWQTEVASQSRPQSRAGRERSVGRVDTSHWEAAMAKAKDQGHPPKTPPQRRRELKAPSPAPPPVPPPRAAAAAVVVLEDRAHPDHDSTPPPPPPPPLPQESELNSIQSLSQEEKEQSVEQWVQQTSTQQAQDELEKFAYEIAETVVSTMEKHQQQQEEHQESSEEVVTTRVSATSAATTSTLAAPPAVRSQASGSASVASATSAAAMTMQEKRRESMNEVQDPKTISVETGKKDRNEERKERSSMMRSLPQTSPPAAESTYKKNDNHFGHVKTGNVNEKRNFWLRSTSMDKLQIDDGNLGPRKQRRGVGGESWIKQAAATEPTRPESSLGQVIAGANDQNVKNAVSGWSDLSKSKSSAAVLQEEKRMRRALSRDRPIFPADQTETVAKIVDLSEAHTHQVKETVTRWGKTPEPTETLRTQTPTRNIGDTFAESKGSKEDTVNANESAAPWRSKMAAVVEPSVKVVNVAVENNASNMHFSESAQALMAKHSKQQETCEVKQTSTATSMQSTSTSISQQEQLEQKTSSMTTVVTQPPPKSPAPSKKGKSSANLARPPPPPPSTSQPPVPTTSIEKMAATSAISKALSTTSSGQVSMRSTTSASHQEQQQEYHESTSSSSIVMGSSTIPDTPVLSGWLAEAEPKKREANPITEPKRVEITQKTEPRKVEVNQILTKTVDVSQKTEPKKVEIIQEKEPKPAEVDKVEATELPEPIDQPIEEKDELRPKTPATSADDNLVTIADNKEFLQVRSRMLQEVASLRIEDDDSSEDFSTSQERAADLAKIERNRELAEISEMRCRSNWQSNSENQLCKSGSNKSLDPELEEARNTIRTAAARWQEREQTQHKARYGTPPSGRNTPSRRIGSLFKKGSDHWSMDDAPVGDDEDQLPPPPTENEIDVSPLPAPPPRDSSKDVMMEYSGKLKSQ